MKLALKSIGYIHEGNLGISGREAFAYKGKEHLQQIAFQEQFYSGVLVGL